MDNLVRWIKHETSFEWLFIPFLKTIKINNDMLEEKGIISKSIVFHTNFDGEKEPDFKYIHNDNNDIAMQTTWGMSDYYLTNTNRKEYDLLEYNNSIYLIDIDKGIIDQSLLEE